MAVFGMVRGGGGDTGEHLYVEQFALAKNSSKTFTVDAEPIAVFMISQRTGTIYNAYYIKSLSDDTEYGQYFHSSTNVNGYVSNTLGTQNSYPPAIGVSGNTVTVTTGNNSAVVSSDYLVAIVY